MGTAKQKLCKKTNRPIVGLVSTDRSVVAALLSTTPRPVTKSSANDLAPQHCTWLFLIRYAALFRVTKTIYWGFSSSHKLRRLASQYWDAK